MPFNAWFPTLIYVAAPRLGAGATSHRWLLRDCLKVREQDREGRRWCRKNYPGGYTSYSSIPQLHRMFSTFGALQKKLDPHVRAFARRADMDLQGGRLEMTDCWVNIMPRGATHSLHLHPLSVISGTYYVRAPGGCSQIRFEDPRLANFMGSPPRRDGARAGNRQHVYYEVRAGRAILFESWLRHEVGPNLVDAERISVSFNYGWVGAPRPGAV